MKIIRNLEGGKGVLILTMTGLAGIILIFSTLYLYQRIETRPSSTTELSPSEALRLGERARGRMPEIPYTAKELARVASFAVAQRINGEWEGLPPGAVLQVAGTSGEKEDSWVNGLVQGDPHNEPIRVHASFLERYLPVMLGNTVELSDVRLVHASEISTSKVTVTGWLRNSTSQTLSQCLVMCTFKDDGGVQLDREIAKELVLRPLQFVHFETAPTATEKEFAEITLEISHATPEGLRNYLPAVLIPHSAGKGAH